MTIGAALFTIAAGAVLAFAVSAMVAGVDLQIVGYILLAIGVGPADRFVGGRRPAARDRTAARVLSRTGAAMRNHTRRSEAARGSRDAALARASVTVAEASRRLIAGTAVARVQ